MIPQPLSGRSEANIASVLVVAADPNIASLCGELVAYAGHRPTHDFTNGVAGESVRRERPDVAIIDAALDCGVVDACVDACDEVRARPVLISSTANEPELIDQAQTRGCIPFPLPGRPQSLRYILDRLIQTKRRARGPVFEWRSPRSVHPAFCAAIASMARARAIVAHAHQVVAITRFSRVEMHESLDRLRRSRDVLSAAVRDYATQLQEERIPETRMLEHVAATLSECAAIVGAEAAIEPLEGEWRAWALEAYRAV